MSARFSNASDFRRTAPAVLAPGWVVAYCDGGSRGNPGPAGFGVLIQDHQGAVLAELSEYLGRRTNNFAEYSGLLAALQFAAAAGHRCLRVISDSELMVKQMKGQYRVNSPDLRPLYEKARQLAATLESFEICHVLRAKNQHADKLANLAMDRGMGKASLPAKTASAPVELQMRLTSIEQRDASLRGVVRNGVVELLDGNLPEGQSVKVTPD